MFASRTDKRLMYNSQYSSGKKVKRKFLAHLAGRSMFYYCINSISHIVGVYGGKYKMT